MVTPEKMATRTAVPTTQTADSHPIKKPAPFGLRAMWLHFANELELRRLSKLHLRIERKQDSLNQLINERQLIMNRCIRRMRRASGKN